MVTKGGARQCGPSSRPALRAPLALTWSRQDLMLLATPRGARGRVSRGLGEAGRRGESRCCASGHQACRVLGGGGLGQRPPAPKAQRPSPPLPPSPALPGLADSRTDLLLLVGFNSSSPALFLFTCPPSLTLRPCQIRCLKILLGSGNSSPRLTRGVDAEMRA